MTDRGEVHFGADVQTGMVTVSVRPPLGLESSKVTAYTTIPELFDIAAQIQLALSAAQRQAAGQLTKPTNGARTQ